MTTTPEPDNKGQAQCVNCGEIGMAHRYRRKEHKT